MNFFASWLMLKNLSRIENREFDYLELFTSLEHLNGEYEKVVDDWGYIPHYIVLMVDGTSVEHHPKKVMNLISYEGNSPQEAIFKALDIIH